MSTPHINANTDDFSDTVVMPGDPLRAKYISEHYLTRAKLVTNVRNMLGYTGLYKGKKISVMSSGMGIPSCSIYATELIKFYGVKKIVRVGSCGAVSDKIKVRDLILAHSVSTDSKVNEIRLNGYQFSLSSDFELMNKLFTQAKNHKIDLKVGNVFTTDSFYSLDNDLINLLRKYNFLAVEMETAGLLGIAQEYDIQAAAIYTVSDHIISNEAMSSDERERSFDEMIRLTLDALI